MWIRGTKCLTPQLYWLRQVRLSYRERNDFWASHNARCPLSANSGHATAADECLLSGVKRT
jgi:hypothetical protein